MNRESVAWLNGRVVQFGSTPAGDHLAEVDLLSRAGRIVAVVPRGALRLPDGTEQIDCRGQILSPGFVDLHVHGGGGGDFMDGTVESVRMSLRTHLRHGTTSICPTTTTGQPDQISAMLTACQAVQAQPDPSREARIVGVHLYGPYFAADKVGCHPLDGRRDPLPVDYKPWLESGIVRIATCAAELPGAEQFYRAAFERGCLVTCGHSNSSWSEMQRAFECGMRHVDHFWCAMSSVPSLRARFGTPMQASMEQFVLAQREMSTEVIADGCHLAPELLRFAWQMKGADRLCLVTDANRAVDLPPGRYRFGTQDDGSWFESDGRVGHAPDGSLASSIQGMDEMVRVMTAACDGQLATAIRMASRTPAERIGLDHEIGSLETGCRADLLLLNEQLRVDAVYLGSQRCSL